jgi:hypothetical protein
MPRDSSGNLASVSRTMFGAQTLISNGGNLPTSIGYPGDGHAHLQRPGPAAEACHGRPSVGWRPLASGDQQRQRVSAGGAACATEGGSFVNPLLCMRRNDGSDRHYLYDGMATGSTRRLVDASVVAADACSIDAFGRYVDGLANETQDPCRFGAAFATSPTRPDRACCNWERGPTGLLRGRRSPAAPPPVPVGPPPPDGCNAGWW